MRPSKTSIRSHDPNETASGKPGTLQFKAEVEAQWAVVADASRERQPKLGALMDASRDDVLASMAFPREHWTQIASRDGFFRQVDLKNQDNPAVPG